MLLRRYPNNWRSNDVLLHALLGVSVIRGKTESHLMNRTLCKGDNTVLNQKRDEEKIQWLNVNSIFQICPVNQVFFQRAFQLSVVKPKSKESQRSISRRRSKNRLQALSVRKRNKPRSRLDLLFNLADSKYGVSFSSTPIILRSRAKPKQSSVSFHTQLESILFSGIVFTLPDVECQFKKIQSLIG